MNFCTGWYEISIWFFSEYAVILHWMRLPKLASALISTTKITRIAILWRMRKRSMISSGQTHPFFARVSWFYNGPTLKDFDKSKWNKCIYNGRKIHDYHSFANAYLYLQWRVGHYLLVTIKGVAFVVVWITWHYLDIYAVLRVIHVLY